MSRTSQLILTFVLIWIVAKMGFMFAGKAIDGFGIMVMLNMLFVLLVEFFSLWFKYKKIKLGETNFLNDLTTCVRAAAVYAISIALFSIVYYSFIDTSVDEFSVSEAVRVATEQSSDADYFQELKRRDPSMPAETTPEEYVENARQTASWFAQWWVRAGGTLFILVILSIVNGMFITLLFRKVLLK